MRAEGPVWEQTRVSLGRKGGILCRGPSRREIFVRGALALTEFGYGGVHWLCVFLLPVTCRIPPGKLLGAWSAWAMLTLNVWSVLS